jgi:sugar phosphate isomerase/epimerase
LRIPGDVHLGYCTNIHAGESWAEVRANVATHVAEVGRRLRAEGALAPAAPFGVGLRLGAQAARELSAPAALDDFRALLAEHRLYVFTINGFPYGRFHGAPVKERVYLPDWLDDERLAYTDGLARLAAALLPDDVAEASVSTVPGAFRPRVRGEDDARAIAARLGRHAATLHALHESTGKLVTLGLEPEPRCFLETAAEAAAFFERFVFAAPVPGHDARTSERILRRHIGVCFDACHMAVEYDAPAEALAAFAAAGVAITKIQISAGLDVQLETPADLAALDRFAADEVYLHQVVERGPDGRAGERWLDLPEAMAAARGAPGSAWTRAREWRIHYHVPLHRERYGRLRSTQRDLAELLRLVRHEPPTRHLEVETYTWDVLPPEHRAADVESEIVRELRWVKEELGC